MLETIERQSGVPDGGRDRAVPEIGLDGASVVAVVGEGTPIRSRGSGRNGYRGGIAGAGSNGASGGAGIRKLSGVPAWPVHHYG